MSIAVEHLKRFMPGYSSDLHDAQATFKQPARCFVSPVVEAEVCGVRPVRFAASFERLAH